MSTAFTAAVSLAIFIFSISSKAQSVTKCGNSGPDSYYNSTTLPYVCTFASNFRSGAMLGTIHNSEV